MGITREIVVTAIEQRSHIVLWNLEEIVVQWNPRQRPSIKIGMETRETIAAFVQTCRREHVPGILIKGNSGLGGLVRPGPAEFLCKSCGRNHNLDALTENHLLVRSIALLTEQIDAALFSESWMQ